MEIVLCGVKDVIWEFCDYCFGVVDEGLEYVEVDENFFEDLVSGVVCN